MGDHLLDVTKTIIQYAARAVEFAAALVIAVAALQATAKAFLLFAKRDATPEQKNQVRLVMARWLALGLEFELAADILNTAVTPTWNDIEKLAAIAAIRTTLNYFLEKEIDSDARPQHEAAQQATMGEQANVLAPLPRKQQRVRSERRAERAAGGSCLRASLHRFLFGLR